MMSTPRPSDVSTDHHDRSLTIHYADSASFTQPYSGRAFCVGKRGKLHQGQMCQSLDVANFHGSQTLLRINYRHLRDCLPDRLKVQRTVVSLWPSTSARCKG
jgi:hypothetical protein